MSNLSFVSYQLKSLEPKLGSWWWKLKVSDWNLYNNLRHQESKESIFYLCLYHWWRLTTTLLIYSIIMCISRILTRTSSSTWYLHGSVCNRNTNREDWSQSKSSGTSGGGDVVVNKMWGTSLVGGWDDLRGPSGRVTTSVTGVTTSDTTTRVTHGVSDGLSSTKCHKPTTGKPHRSS